MSVCAFYRFSREANIFPEEPQEIDWQELIALSEETKENQELCKCFNSTLLLLLLCYQGDIDLTSSLARTLEKRELKKAD